MTGRRRATPDLGGRVRLLGYALSPVPALAVQLTYILYSLNTLVTITPGPVPEDFDSRFDAPGGVPFHLPWVILVPSVLLAGVAVMSMIRDKPSSIRDHRPYFLGFVWGLGSIYTYGYGIGFIAQTRFGNGMLLVSGCLALCSVVSMATASVQLVKKRVSGSGQRQKETAAELPGHPPHVRGDDENNPPRMPEDLDAVSFSRDES